jgi:hypothetical protein
MGLEMAQQLVLALWQRGEERSGQGGAAHHDEGSGSGCSMAPNAQPAGREHSAECAEKTGVAQTRHLRDQPLPVGIDGRPLQNGQHGLKSLVSKEGGALVQALHN